MDKVQKIPTAAEIQAWKESMQADPPLWPEHRAIAHVLMRPEIWAALGPDQQAKARRMWAAHQQDIMNGWEPPPGYKCDCPRSIDITA